MDDFAPTRTLRFALVLTLGSGFMDAYTYLARGGTFAITQTGNMVLFAVDAATRNWDDARAHVWPIPAFMLGIAMAARIEAGHARLAHPLRWAVGAQVAALVAIGFLPASTPHAFITVPVAFLGAVQIGLFRTVGDLTYMPSAGSAPISGFNVTFVRESISEFTEWRYDEPHHVIAVYESGQMRSKEVEFDRGPFQQKLPKSADVMVIPAGRRMTFCAQGERAEFCQLIVDPKLFDQRELQPLLGAQDPLLYQLIRRFRGVAGREDLIARLLRDSVADVLRLHLIDHYAKVRGQNAKRGGLTPALQTRLVEYIEYGLDSELSLAGLARNAQMSVSEFRIAFAQVFHKTPYQFVLDRRMSRAKRLLATTTLSLTDISVAVGFSSPSHFATTFKSRVGVAPTAYREGL